MSLRRALSGTPTRHGYQHSLRQLGGTGPLSGYAGDMRLVLMMLGAIVLLMLISFVISAVKWLLIVAAVAVAVGLLVGWRPGRTTADR